MIYADRPSLARVTVLAQWVTLREQRARLILATTKMAYLSESALDAHIPAGAYGMLGHGQWNNTEEQRRHAAFHGLDDDALDLVFRSSASDGREQKEKTGSGMEMSDTNENNSSRGGEVASSSDGSSGYDAVGGSFVAFVASRHGPPARAAQLDVRAVAAELDCSIAHTVGTRGFIAHESSGVQFHAVRDDSVSVAFIGHLENRAALAESCDLHGSATCAELVHRLYGDCGTSFVNQLDGFFAFVLVDAESSAVFAAVDRHGSIPLYKGRSKDGGVFIAHAARSSGSRSLRSLGEMHLIPAGSYVHGHRHLNPHKYARSADAERMLREMDRDNWRACDQSATATTATTTSTATATTHSFVDGVGMETASMLSAGEVSSRSMLSGGAGLYAAVHGHGSAGTFSTRTSIDNHVEYGERRLRRSPSGSEKVVAVPVPPGRRGGASYMDSMHDWNSMTRSWSSAHLRRRSFQGLEGAGASSLDDDDDATEEEEEPESRMGTLFRRVDPVIREGSVAMFPVKEAAAGSAHVSGRELGHHVGAGFHSRFSPGAVPLSVAVAESSLFAPTPPRVPSVVDRATDRIRAGSTEVGADTTGEQAKEEERSDTSNDSSSDAMAAPVWKPHNFSSISGSSVVSRGTEGEGITARHHEMTRFTGHPTSMRRVQSEGYLKKLLAASRQEQNAEECAREGQRVRKIGRFGSGAGSESDFADGASCGTESTMEDGACIKTMHRAASTGRLSASSESFADTTFAYRAGGGG